MGHLAQLVLLDLLRRSHREDVEEVHILRNLEPGDPVLAEHLNVMFRKRHAVGRDDERRRLFAILLGGTADNRHVLHAGHRADEVLYLLGRDVLAAADDEILESAGDVVVAILVHAANVTGMEPAVFVDALRGLLGHLVVALHVVVAAAADFAISVDGRDLTRLGIDDGDFDSGHRLTDRLALALDGLLEVTRHRHHGARLGKAVRVRDFAHEHPLLCLLHAVHGACRTGHDAGAEGTEIKLGEERMVEHRDVHRGNAVRCGALLLLYGRHHLHGVELLEEHHRRTVVHAAHHAKHAAEAVEERNGDANTIAAGEVLAGSDPEAVVRDVAVRELDALREAGRAGRVLHVHHIVHVAFCLTGKIFLLRRFAGEALHLIQRVHPAVLLAAEEENALEARILRAVQLATRLLLELRNELVDDLHVVAITESVDYEEVFGIGLLEREVHFLGLVVRVERQQNGAYLRGGKHENHPVRDVRRPECDLLTLLDAERHQPLGDKIDLLAEFKPRKTEIAIGIHDGIVLAATRNRLIKKLPKRVLAGDGQVVPRHSCRNALVERRLGRGGPVRICKIELRHCFFL